MTNTTADDRPTRRYTQRARARQTAQTRRRILDAAYAALLSLPYDDVTLAMIAADAGVSVPTVLRHFGSKDNLVLEGAPAWNAAERARRTVPPGDASAVARVLARRYEELGPMMNRAIGLADRFPELAEAVAQARRGHADWLAEAFAADLPAGDGPARRRCIAQLFIATEQLGWEGLRTGLGLSAREAEVAMAATIEAVVASWEPDGRGAR